MFYMSLPEFVWGCTMYKRIYNAYKLMSKHTRNVHTKYPNITYPIWIQMSQQIFKKIG